MTASHSSGAPAAILLALDAATRRTSVAVGDERSVHAQRLVDREAGALLTLIELALAEAGLAARDLAGLVVGTGPGSFTGLRVALATAKTMAHALDLPIMGVPTTEGLALAATIADPSLVDRSLAVLQRAGARDHYLARVACPAGTAGCRSEPPELVPPDIDLATAVGTAVPVAVDLEAGSIHDRARSLGEDAVAGLAGALLRIGGWRIRAGEPADDVATLVPAYVALPRGITDAVQDAAWSPDLR